jgi:type I restriction enzyme S subunit
MRDGWVEYKFKDVATAVKGKLPKTKNENGIGIPYLTANFLRSSKPDYWIENIEGAVTAEDGDCLILWDGAGAGDLFSAHRGVVSSTMAVVTTQNSKILREFLTLFISSKAEYIKETCRGTTVPHVSPDAIANMDLMIPPLSEQERIVDFISSVDSYIEALQQQLESAKRSRNAVLHQLLTAGDDDWETTTIGNISDFVSVRKSPEQLSADSIYVGLEHLEPNNTSIDNFDAVSKVTSSLTPFDVGDVLFGRLRPYLHKVAIAEMFGFCSPEILVLRANPKVLPQMLLLFCDADSTIKICVERSAGTRMPRTSTEDLASIEIKLPPIVEQIKLAELSSTFDTDISHLGIALEKSKILRSGLLSDLLSGTHEIPAIYDKVMGAA